jgi:hypothetical protein
MYKSVKYGGSALSAVRPNHTDAGDATGTPMTDEILSVEGWR